MTTKLMTHKRCIQCAAAVVLVVAGLAGGAMGAKLSGRIIDSSPGHGVCFLYVVRLSIDNPIAGMTMLPAPGTWEVRNVANGSYFIVAWRDLNGNLLPSRGEPMGFYGNPFPAMVQVSTSDISNLDVTLGQFSFAAEINGTVTYNGAKTGRIWIVPHVTPELSLANTRGTPWTMTVPGAYQVFVFQDDTYYVTAYMDVNGNLIHDDGEPIGTTETPVVARITPGATYFNANILLKDDDVGVQAKTWNEIKQLYR